jgi:hypothetical protein
LSKQRVSGINKLNECKGEKPGLVVRAEDPRPRGRGFESRCILDGCKRFASYYIKGKLKIKLAKLGHITKIFKKTLMSAGEFQTYTFNSEIA